MIKDWLKRNVFLTELVWAFVVLDILNFIFLREDMGFRSWALSPYWIPVLFLSSRYGFLAGILTGITAMGHAMYFASGGQVSFDNFEQLAEKQELIIPFAFVLTGMVLGRIRQQVVIGLRQKEEALAAQNKELRKLKEYAEYSEKSRHVLEARIVGQMSTMETLYETARKLETLELNDAYKGCLEMLAKHFQVKKSSLYIKEGDYLILKAAYGWSERGVVEGKIHPEKSLMKIVFEENRPITVRDIISNKNSQAFVDQYGQVLAMFPIRSEGDHTIGVVNVEKMDFLSLNRTNLQMISRVVEWVSQAMHKHMFLKSLKAQIIYDEEYHIYTYDHFKTVLEEEFIRARQWDSPLTVSLIKLERFGFLKEETQHIFGKAVVNLLKKFMASTDMIFKYRFAGMLILVSPMQKLKSVQANLKLVENALAEISPEDFPDGFKLKVTATFQELTKDTGNPAELIPAFKEARVAK